MSSVNFAIPDFCSLILNVSEFLGGSDLPQQGGQTDAVPHSSSCPREVLHGLTTAQDDALKLGWQKGRHH